jgi:hypothetical protein
MVNYITVAAAYLPLQLKQTDILDYLGRKLRLQLYRQDKNDDGRALVRAR